MDLFAATCWDASETPTVEGARQFWELLGGIVVFLARNDGLAASGYPLDILEIPPCNFVVSTYCLL